MELNWTTFVLEIINFLVLVWLLQRFLYTPVKAVIRKRQKNIQEQLQLAENTQQEIDDLRQRYENRLVDWENERTIARGELRLELEKERKSQLDLLNQELEAERKRSEVLAGRAMEELQHQNEVEALELGARFSAKLLHRVASEEVQDRLVSLLLEEWQQLPIDLEKVVSTMTKNGDFETVRVISAYQLNHETQGNLEEKLDVLLARSCKYEYTINSELIAGVRICIGPWIIHANLQDELKGFATLIHEK